MDDIPIDEQARALLLGAHCGNCDNLSIKTQRTLMIMQCTITNIEVHRDFYCKYYSKEEA